MVTTIEALGKVELFRGLAVRGLERVASICSEETYAANHVLFHEGDAGDKLYVIVDGKTRISRRVPGMGEEALAVLGPGSSFGEMALIDEVPRSADAIVHERCKLLVLSKEALQDLMFLDKELAYEVLWNTVRILSRRLRETNDKMTFMSISARF
ncbi:MAG TPA: cyclic nucleotide-binding domain-containing protein [Polyangiales bacterium]